MRPKSSCVALLVATVALTPLSGLAAGASAAKRAAVGAIDKHADELSKLSDQIWAFAETALQEHRSAKLLADFAESQGFTVERGIAGMPTAFVATYGNGSPIIAIMGEYDALPGVSQKAEPEESPLAEGAAGHACGHNLFGAASLGAALAIKEQIAAKKLNGTIRFYGTPAEESIGGKTYMARDGVFNDVDVMFAWHPGDATHADTTSSQAMVDAIVEFKGRSAHAALDPWNARSAADAAEAFTYGVNLMREHIKTTSRIHYVISHAGDVPNVVPDTAKVWIWARDWERKEVDALIARLRKAADGAALMTETTATFTIQNGNWEVLTNAPGARLLDANLRWVGAPKFTPEEHEFARRIQQATDVPTVGLDTSIKALDEQQPEGGSTDVGDVSWVVPTLNLTVVTAPKDAPWHAWPVVATGGMSIGHKGMVVAAKVLAATMVDLYEKPAAIRDIRADFEKKRGNVRFEAYLPPGSPPIPD